MSHYALMIGGKPVTTQKSISVLNHVNVALQG
jgi:hypothetical protein